MLCTASSHFVFDLCRRPFYGCARRLLFVHKETPGTRLEGGIEKSVPRITDWQHEHCRVMTNGDREGKISLYHPHKNNGFLFLLTTKYLILYQKT